MAKLYHLGDLIDTETGERKPLLCTLVETEDDLRKALGMPPAKCEGCPEAGQAYPACEEYGCLKSPDTRVGRMFGER